MGRRKYDGAQRANTLEGRTVSVGRMATYSGWGEYTRQTRRKNTVNRRVNAVDGKGRK